MANIQSNIKRGNQDKKRNLLNHMQMSALKTQIKKTKASKKPEDLNESYKKIDSSLSKGIITKNKANRLKARLSASVAKAPEAQVEVKKTRKASTKKATAKTTKKAVKK